MTCNKCILALIGVIVMTCILCATKLAIDGKEFAAFIGVATTAIGVISKSALEIEGKKDVNNP